jgi:gliding motility-associated-like protein
VEITDASNCVITQTIIVGAASSESLSLGDDQTILVGDSTLISPVISFTPVTFTWTGDTSEINTNQLNNWIRPEEDVDLTLTAFDEKGCRYQDDIHIRVLLTSAITVPNVFSPNGDGINDLIAPSADPSIVAIDYFEIYSRWGELIYEVRDAAPDQPGLGWNGKFHEELMNPGVFLYRLGAHNKRGQEFFLYGDITLVR